MARQFQLRAILNFNFVDHAEMTATRTKAINFAAANNGEYDLLTNEDPENVNMPYYGKLKFTFLVESRAAANTIETAIDGALDNLPDLVVVNGYKLRYDLREDEV